METRMERDIRILKKMYAVMATLLLALPSVVGFAAMAAQTPKQKFNEIDVERINIVEKDGTIKLVIANKERLPGPVVGGKTYERAGLKSPGILFYNDKGNESGGLRTASTEGSGKYVAGGGLAFDKYDGDEVIGMRYNEENGNRTVGLRILDQPDAPAEEQKRNFDEARTLPPGPERDALRQQAVASPRVFVGRSADRSAIVTLSDANGRPRLRMSVAAGGEAKLEFLDVDGKVVQSLPAPDAAKAK
jgi:hypothetical protein